MENKDQPAFGLSKVRFISLEGTVYYDDTKLGLTKRELVAAMAMQGILASEPDFNCQPSELAKRSIQCADALLANLSEGK